MIDEKRLEQEYRKLQNDKAPDLWDRIEERLEERPQEHPEQGCAAGEELAERQGPTARKESTARQESAGETTGFRYLRYGYGLTAAAAVIAITVGLGVTRNGRSMVAETTVRVEAAATEALAETKAEAAAGPLAETTAAIEQGDTAAVMAGGVVTLQQLSVPGYTALSVPRQAITVPEDAWYFSEDILADTELLCGAQVNQVSFEYDGLGNAVSVVYDMTIDEVYYAEDYASPAEQIQVKSPIVKTDGDEAYLLYQLQTDGAYLLPLKNEEGTWELLYPFAPQVQVLKNGGYLFHSGYASLMDSDTSVVIGQQEAANDYYYDRMLFRSDDSFLSDFLSLVEHEVHGRS